MFPAFLTCILLAAAAFSMTSSATIASTDGYCVHEAEMYKPGQQIVIQDCQYKCQCVLNEGYSFFMCEPLCKEFYFDLTCADGEEPIKELEDTEVPECKCPVYSCPKRIPVSSLIDYGTDQGGLFEPDVYEEKAAPEEFYEPELYEESVPQDGYYEPDLYEDNVAQFFQ